MALEPHGGDLAGFLLIQSDADKLARVRASDEMTALNTRAELVLEGRPADRREVLSVT